MLSDDNLGDAFVVRVRVVVLVAVEKHNHVGVLLDRPRVTQVAQERALVVTLLDGARELGDGEDRYIQITSQHFKTAADLGYLLLPVVRAVALPDHELQVVHNDERERRLALSV